MSPLKEPFLEIENIRWISVALFAVPASVLDLEADEDL